MKNLSVLMLLFATATLFSCVKDKLHRPNENPNRDVDLCDLGDIGYQGMNDGQIHNDLVHLIISEYNICSSDPEDIASEIERIFTDSSTAIVNLIEGYDWNYSRFKNLVLDSVDIYAIVTDTVGLVNKIDSLNFSSGTDSVFKGFVNLVFGINDTSAVYDAQQLMCEYYDDHVGSLNSSDQVQFGMMVDVARNSCELWLPTSLGGQNKYAEFQSILNSLCFNNSNIEPRWWDWGAIIGVDYVSAIGAVATSLVASGGAFAIPNPAFGGIPTAGVIGLIGGAVGSIGKAM